MAYIKIGLKSWLQYSLDPMGGNLHTNMRKFNMLIIQIDDILNKSITKYVEDGFNFR